MKKQQQKKKRWPLQKLQQHLLKRHQQKQAKKNLLKKKCRKRQQQMTRQQQRKRKKNKYFTRQLVGVLLREKVLTSKDFLAILCLSELVPAWVAMSTVHELNEETKQFLWNKIKLLLTTW